MLGISAQVLSHVVRRGLPTDETSAMSEAYAHGYMPAGELEINYFAIFVALAVVIITLLLLVSIEYTIENVVGTLAMIESDSTTTPTISSSFAKEPDNALKATLLGDEADVETVTTQSKPITTSIKSTIRHLHRIGGFRARWRGAGQALLYIVARVILGDVLGLILFGGQQLLVASVVGSIIASLLLCRLHLLWTHAIVAMPTSTPWYRRFVARKDSRAVLLPTFVYTIASTLAILVPFGILCLFDVFERTLRSFTKPNDATLTIFAYLLGLAVCFLFLFFVAIPLHATLVRVETCLLPEKEQTIVPFDREAILGSVDLSTKGALGKLFAAAWKSFSYAARLRLIKLYLKLFVIELGICLLAVLLSFGILYVSGQLWVIAVFVM